MGNTEPNAASIVSSQAQRGQPFRAMAKRLLRLYPLLFIPIFRAIGGATAGELLISSHTQVVIEGYPRSSSTFLVVAFHRAGNHDVRIAHHLHAECQIIAGAQRGLPMMFLVREPEAAVRSLKMMFPSMDVNDALRDWTRFYRRVLPHRHDVFFGEFSRVTSAFGAVMAAFKNKIGTDFALFEYSEKNINDAYEEIEEIDRNISGGSYMYVARPSKVKHDARARTRFVFDETLLATARAVYARIMVSVEQSAAVAGA